MFTNFLRLGFTLLKALFLALVLTLLSLISALVFDYFFGIDISGWIQTFIAAFGFLIVLYQVDQIFKEISQRPEIEIGLVNIKALPFSRVRTMDALPKEVNVSSGYAHFYIILRNNGTAAAKHVKIYVEHLREEQPFPLAFVKVSEFSENKHSFVNEHNFDFVFRGGNDWIINPSDIEPFGFQITTSIVIEEREIQGKIQEIRENPPPGIIKLNCTVWAEGLQKPVTENFLVQVIPS